MQSSDPQNFFETDAAQELRERRSAKSGNKYGCPVALKSKVLAVLADPKSASHVFVAESAGSARRVNVDAPPDGETKSYRGPTAPVTCLALGGPGGKTLFAGSWDKTVWSFDRDTRQPGLKYVGHTDFVKAVVCARLGGSLHVLISGGADKKIIVWDIASGKRLHTLQDSGPTVSDRQSMLAVQDLAIDPVATTADEILLVSASSDPNIRRWRIRKDGWEQVVEEERGDDSKNGSEQTKKASKSLLAHETTVYKVVFEDYNYSGGGSAADDEDGEEVDLWTSSADGTVKCLSRLHGFQHDGSGASNTYQHGNHARAVAVTDSWVVTAGRDEDLQYWDRSGATEDNNDDGNSRYATITGHFDEVTDLVVLGDRRRLCSVSLDGTVRTWPLIKAEVDALVKQQREDLTAAAAGVVEEKEKDGEAEPESVMTAEEEAELAELMGDD